MWNDAQAKPAKENGDSEQTVAGQVVVKTSTEQGAKQVTAGAKREEQSQAGQRRAGIFSQIRQSGTKRGNCRTENEEGGKVGDSLPGGETHSICFL